MVIHYVGASDWTIPVALIGLTFVALILWSYLRAATSSAVRLMAALLKIAAIGLLLLCLLEPLISGVRPRSGANVLAILVDNSRSMRISGRGIPAAKDLPRWFGPDDAGWRARLAQDFDVRVYAFDRELRHVEDPTALSYDGDASNLAAAMSTLSDRFSNRPLAGVLLLSDGSATDLRNSQGAWQLPNCPIFPVWTRSSSKPRDIRLQQVRINQTHFETSPTTIVADVTANGYVGQKVVTQLIDNQDKVVEEQIVTLPGNSQPVPVSYRFRPEKSGVNFYRLQAFAESDRDQFLKTQSTSEATTENNVRTLLVNRGGGPFRILYAAGRPNWEFKFLRRALDADDEIQLIGLLRIANKEPKFQFQDRSGTGDTNRFFEGFEDVAQEENESYDHPVFVRIILEDTQELAEGFPSTVESLFKYDAVILDDLEASFFSPDQMLLMRRYVSQRGGGLLMLGGVASFTQGGYAKTPIGEMLPVYLSRGDVRQPGSRVSLQLTREGMLETWTRLRPTEAEEQNRIKDMPGFFTLNAVGDVKPGGANSSRSAGRSNGTSCIGNAAFRKRTL